MRNVLLGGAIGAIPGSVVALVPLLLHGAGVISSDQSQIGFAGVPLLIVGVLVGTLIAGSGTPHGGRVAIGVLIGFVVGLATGLLVAAALPGVLKVVWLFTTPAAMIAGGALAAWTGEHGSSPGGSVRGSHPRHV